MICYAIVGINGEVQSDNAVAAMNGVVRIGSLNRIVVGVTIEGVSFTKTDGFLDYGFVV